MWEERGWGAGEASVKQVVLLGVIAYVHKKKKELSDRFVFCAVKNKV